MPQTVSAKFVLTRSTGRVPLPYPYDTTELVPLPSGAVQPLAAGLSPVHRYLTLHLHEATLPDARFEELLFSGEVGWLINVTKHADLCSIGFTGGEQHASP